VGLEIEGADKVREVARALKLHGDKLLTREVNKGLNRTVKPLGSRVKASMPSFLPKRYAAELAGSLRVTSRRRTGRDPGVRLVGVAKTRAGRERNLAALDKGNLRHPLYGDREHWFDEKIRAGVWTDPLTDAAPQIRRDLERALDDAADVITRKIL